MSRLRISLLALVIIAVAAIGGVVSRAQTIGPCGVIYGWNLISRAYAQVIIGPCSSGQTYYVANGGSDSANGLTPATAWQTISHVNAQTGLLPGSTVLFNGGQTFTGGVVLTTSVITSGPTIGSYGTGQATISSGNSTECVKATDVPGVRVTNIVCTGGGNTSNTTAGIAVINDQAGNTQLTGPTIIGVTVSGYGGDCIGIYGSNGQSGFSGINIENFVGHDSTGNAVDSDGGNACVRIYSAPGYPNIVHSNISLYNITAYNVNGFASQTLWTGSGIQVSEATNVTGDVFLVHDFGASNTNNSGPCGVWAFNSSNVHFSKIEVYRGGGGGTGAACGVDLDGGVTNSLIEQFWVHDNNGPGALLFTYNDGTINSSSNNTLRDFITQNNCHAALSGCGEVIIGASSGATLTAPQAFNFDCYAGVGSLNGEGEGCLGQTTTGTIAGAAYVANAMLYGVAGTNLINMPSPGTLALQGNDYYGSPDFSWNGSSYTSYASFISGSGQESVNGGHTFNPDIYVPGGGFGTGGYAPLQMMAYNPQVGSSLIGAGINLQSQFGINPGTQDFFGNTITASTLPIGAGAADFASFASSCAQTTTFLGLVSSFSKLDNVNYNSWICGSNFDGDLALMDVAYLLAAPNHAAMLLDVSGNGHNLTEHGTVTFTARPTSCATPPCVAGIASDGVSGYEDTGWQPSAGPNGSQNSATTFGYDISTGACSQSPLFPTILGTQNTAGTAEITLVPCPATVSHGWYCDLNDESGTSPVASPITQSGGSMCQRTASATLTSYRDGGNGHATSPASVAAISANMFLLAENNGGGSGITSSFMTDTISTAFVGGGGISPLNTWLRAQSFNQAYQINPF